MNSSQLFEQRMKQIEGESLLLKQEAQVIAQEIAGETLEKILSRAAQMKNGVSFDKGISLVYQKQMLLEEVARLLEEKI